MINNLFIFFIAFYLVIKGSTMATNYAARLAESYKLSKYTVGFIIVAVISVLPETFIAINSAIEGSPSFGLGMVLGSNIADLTLVFAIIVLLVGRSLKVENKILKNHVIYPFVLLLPIILGFDGFFSRVEGVVLMVTGAVFYYLALSKETDGTVAPEINQKDRFSYLLRLLFSMALLLAGAHFVVTSATDIATTLKVSPILIGILAVGLGTTLPELFFSLLSVKKRDDSLAIGDLLGTVLADATIVVGILALIKPFYFPERIIYITGVFMVAAAFILFYFMRSGRALARREAYLLLAFWVLFVLVEFAANI